MATSSAGEDLLLQRLLRQRQASDTPLYPLLFAGFNYKMQITSYLQLHIVITHMEKITPWIHR